MSDPGGTEVDDLLAEMAPREITVRVLLRQEMLTEHAELERQLEAEMKVDDRENRTAVAPQIAARLRDLEDEIEQAKRSFTFRSLGRRAWADLLAKHPPSKEQKRADPRVTFNDKFPVAVIAASSVTPDLTLEHVIKLEEGLPDLEFAALWNAAAAANLGGDDSPKSLAAGAILRLSGASATTAVNGESLAPSS